ncbi:type II toxin-antitoxin system RelE/ParE family toxin [Candidatus Woesearchaeota archaeon]|nr:type II toxin-antitoxin system RelE/ParE family toxin [Candidatus Woesearchaeota archaeon]
MNGYKYKIKPTLKSILKKLKNKDKNRYERVLNKIEEIINSDPEHYKNLRKPLQHLKRVHIGSYVLVFHFDKKNKLISFENLEHHDDVYD